tara:strand:+ start:98 stop:634 length:537 start_codon:yes stop_codon:yes gene_type:complete
MFPNTRYTVRGIHTTFDNELWNLAAYDTPIIDIDSKCVIYDNLALLKTLNIKVNVIIQTAAYRGRSEILEWVLQQGADIWHRDNYALRMVAERNHLDAAKCITRHLEGRTTKFNIDDALFHAIHTSSYSVFVHLFEWYFNKYRDWITMSDVFDCAWAYNGPEYTYLYANYREIREYFG